MKCYIIVHKKQPDKILANLQYNPRTEQFSLQHIVKDVKVSQLPEFLRLFVQKGMYEPGEEWSGTWVRSRIIPEDR